MNIAELQKTDTGYHKTEQGYQAVSEHQYLEKSLRGVTMDTLHAFHNGRPIHNHAFVPSTLLWISPVKQSDLLTLR